MNRQKLLSILMGGKVDPQNTPLTMTVTTTGAQTLTFAAMTVATGKSVVVDWGDGSTNTYTAGSGSRTHAYSNAGVWTVKVANRGSITELELQDTKITGLVISASNPLPSGLTYLALISLPGVTYNVNNSPLPSGLTYLRLSTLTGLTYNANTNPLPTGLKTLILSTLTGLTYNANTNPLPTGLTSLSLTSLAGLTYNANTNPLPSTIAGSMTLTNLANYTHNVAANPWPAGVTALNIQTVPNLTWEINGTNPYPGTGVDMVSCPLVTVSAWTNNAIRSIKLENAYSQANVDAVLNAILANKANFTWATPALDLLGGSNAAPSGTYQAADPVTSGNEAAYALVNGNGSYAPGPEWTVTTA